MIFPTLGAKAVKTYMIKETTTGNFWNETLMESPLPQRLDLGHAICLCSRARCAIGEGGSTLCTEWCSQWGKKKHHKIKATQKAPNTETQSTRLPSSALKKEIQAFDLSHPQHTGNHPNITENHPH